MARCQGADGAEEIFVSLGGPPRACGAKEASGMMDAPAGGGPPPGLVLPAEPGPPRPRGLAEVARSGHAQAADDTGAAGSGSALSDGSGGDEPGPAHGADAGGLDGGGGPDRGRSSTGASRGSMDRVDSSASSLNLYGATISSSPHFADEAEAEAAARAANGGEKELPGVREAPSINLPRQRASPALFAIDIGGSLLKIVYFSPDSTLEGLPGGRLHFVKFETRKVEQAIDFIRSMGLTRGLEDLTPALGHRPPTVKATGGGAFKYAQLFADRLGVVLTKEDEMSCLVAGANFLLRAIRDEAFTFARGVKQFVALDEAESFFPYLLVNIGSGVSMLRVDGKDAHQRVSGTNLGGGTFWGLCRLLTGCSSFDEMLKLSAQGDNRRVDMMVGDIYGGLDYAKVGLSADTIASSFGKVVMYGDRVDLADGTEPAAGSSGSGSAGGGGGGGGGGEPLFSKADIALSLLRMVSYNIGQIAVLNAMRLGLKRIFFGGFFIRGHAYTMETLSFAIDFWSKGELKAMFLRHEGFLGALGAFLQYDADLRRHFADRPHKAHCVERFPMGAPVTGGNVHGPPIRDMGEKLAWVEKFIRLHDAELPLPPAFGAAPGRTAAAEPRADAATGPAAAAGPMGGAASPGAAVGSPPPAGPDALVAAAAALALAPPASFSPPSSPGLHSQPGLLVGVLHLNLALEPFPLLHAPAAYAPDTLDIASDAVEREYWISVVLETLPSLMEKAVASEGDTPDARRRAGAFARAFAAHLARLRAEPTAYGAVGLAVLFEMREDTLREFSFADAYRPVKDRENAAALQVLRDLLTEVDAMAPGPRLLALVAGVLAGNIFDWGARACVEMYTNGTILERYRTQRASCALQRPWRVDDFAAFAARLGGPYGEGADAAHEAAAAAAGTGEGGLAAPRAPAYRRALLFLDNSGADAVLGMLPLARELLRLGTDVVLVANTLPAINDITAEELAAVVQVAGGCCPILAAAAAAGAEEARRAAQARQARAGPASPPGAPGAGPSGAPGGGGGRGPTLSVVASGHGGPCIDLRRVSSELADVAAGADLVVLEGMGRAIHTNYFARFRCDVLKVALLKNLRLSERLFGGRLYDCVCRFEPRAEGSPGGPAA